MSLDLAESLTLFFGVQPEQIEKDLASAKANPDPIIQDVRAYQKLPPESKTAERAAMAYHNQMLWAHAFQQHAHVPEDERAYFAGFHAQQIAQDACEAAHNQGPFEKLSRAMNEIEAREGLGPGEFWQLDEGPPEYQQLSSESEDLYKRFQDAVVLRVLQKYRFEKLATLFENDRMTFDVIMEVGRRLFDRNSESDSEIEWRMEDSILNEHGIKGLDLFHQRLRAARESQQ